MKLWIILFYSLLKQYIKSCNAKQQRQRERWKIGLISTKATLHVQHNFLYISLPLLCTTTTWNFKNFLVTRLMEETSYGFLFTFFFHCRSFSPRWLLQNLMLFLQQKMSPLLFLSCSSSFTRCASLACCPTISFSPSFSFSIFQICGHHNY